VRDFCAKDTQVDPNKGAQAYQATLERGDNPNFRGKLIPDSDHNIILSETGCLEETDKMSRSEWLNYAPGYLDVLEEWLRDFEL
jgi:hypothetical protein